MDRAERATAALAAHPWAGGGPQLVTPDANCWRGGERRRQLTDSRVMARDRAAWERDVPRLTTDPTDRRDRLRCLGNAVVPQVARVIGQWIGHAILESER